jgi:uncharacterized membrane protein
LIAGAATFDRPTRWIGLTFAGLLGAIVTSGEITFAIQGAVDDDALRRALTAAARTLVASSVVVGCAMGCRVTGRIALAAITIVAAIVSLLALEHAFRALQRPPHALLILNPVCLGALAMPLALLAASRLMREGRTKPIAIVFAVTAAILGLVVFTTEAHRFFSYYYPDREFVVDAGSAAVSVTWAAYAALVLAIGISRQWRFVRLGALLLLAGTLAKVALYDLSELDRLARILSFVALGAVMMCGAWAYHRFGKRIFGD